MLLLKGISEVKRAQFNNTQPTVAGRSLAREPRQKQSHRTMNPITAPLEKPHHEKYFVHPDSCGSSSSKEKYVRKWESVYIYGTYVLYPVY